MPEVELDSWFTDNLVCPRNHSPLKMNGDHLISSDGSQYPIINGVPIMLLEETAPTIPLAKASLGLAKNPSTNHQISGLYAESLGISEEEKTNLIKLLKSGSSKIDPVVSFLIAATNGMGYKNLLGKLDCYPIPDLRLPASRGATFLDIGCSWGRWCIAAERKGYHSVGIDPSLGAVMAARRVAKQLGFSSKYVVADARFLPFRDRTFDVVFSYSVLQHFSREDAAASLTQIAKVLKPQGVCFVQMPNCLGMRSLYWQIRRGFREASNFEVRYWSIRELKKLFGHAIGKVAITSDCFFGLGLQFSDLALMSFPKQLLIRMSEFLRRLSGNFPILVHLSDSVYIQATKAD